MKKTDIIHIFLASDDNFTLPLTNTLSSILRNADENDFHFFHILDKDISQKHKKEIEKLKKIKNFDIEYIKIDNTLFTKCPLTKECSHIPKQTYYRYLIPQLAPKLEKVLYLDCDILVISSLRELWNIELKNTYCGVVEEMYQKTQSDAKRLNIESYFNAGILLINNKKWVDEKLDNALFKATETLHNENNLIWQDQDVLNYVCNNNVTWIKPKFNLQQHCHNNYTYTKHTKDDIIEAQNNPVIIHYNTSIKPWNKMFECNFKQKEYVKEMLYNKYYKEFLLNIIRYILTNIFKIYNEYNNGIKHKVFIFFGIKIKKRKSK